MKIKTNKVFRFCAMLLTLSILFSCYNPYVSAADSAEKDVWETEDISVQHGWPEPAWSAFIPVDVAETDYYYDSILWAINGGVAKGVGESRFSPEDPCTRGQIVTFLWRAAGCPDPVATENPFTDISPEDYYYNAVLWATQQGITKGVGKGRFSPESTCTRGQVATFLWRAQGEPASDGYAFTYKDVPAGAYYTDAVAWASEKGITNGVGKTRFAPEGQCTRGQIVTFLWRVAGRPGTSVLSPYQDVLSKYDEADADGVKYLCGVLCDLNSDGVQELIMMYRGDFARDYCDAYTIQQGEVVPLLEQEYIATLVGGNDSSFGVAEMDGERYVYTYARYYDGGHLADGTYADYLTYVWKLYAMEGAEMSLAQEMVFYLVEHSRDGAWLPVPGETYATKNDEVISVEEYMQWYENLKVLLGGNGVEAALYSLNELRTLCE